ncbi:hypothetical protein DFH11DRAFT_1514738 [Phellopilus nigrolimitatus]|nr:hypothetical protein DFH11DRAFT_1514738 [Phellopilus nigrolimitatus]
MLVVHPTSTCDVCLEGYSGGSENIPYSISCGHVFCLSCLRSLRHHNCPLCRSSFDASDVRRLHVDQTQISNNNALGLFDDVPRATQLQNKINDLVLQSSFTSGVRESGVRELIQEVHSFLDSEPSERVSFYDLVFFSQNYLPF